MKAMVDDFGYSNRALLSRDPSLPAWVLSAPAQSTVAKYMARRGRGREQTWKTFLHNHAAGIGAMDFLVVPTINFRLLFVLVILRHERRRWH
jgi:hypothetical protein